MGGGGGGHNEHATGGVEKRTGGRRTTRERENKFRFKVTTNHCPPRREISTGSLNPVVIGLNVRHVGVGLSPRRPIDKRRTAERAFGFLQFGDAIHTDFVAVSTTELALGHTPVLVRFVVQTDRASLHLFACGGVLVGREGERQEGRRQKAVRISKKLQTRHATRCAVMEGCYVRVGWRASDWRAG